MTIYDCMDNKVSPRVQLLFTHCRHHLPSKHNGDAAVAKFEIEKRSAERRQAIGDRRSGADNRSAEEKRTIGERRTQAERRSGIDRRAAKGVHTVKP